MLRAMAPIAGHRASPSARQSASPAPATPVAGAFSVDACRTPKRIRRARRACPRSRARRRAAIRKIPRTGHRPPSQQSDGNFRIRRRNTPHGEPDTPDGHGGSNTSGGRGGHGGRGHEVERAQGKACPCRHGSRQGRQQARTRVTQNGNGRTMRRACDMRRGHPAARGSGRRRSSVRRILSKGWGRA